MKKAFLFSLCLLWMCTSMSQVAGGEYSDLFDLFSLDKHEKCIKAASKYTEKEDSENDAEPYLYLSMSNYQLAKKMVEKGKSDSTSIREALVNAAKYLEKDRDKKLYKPNKWYLRELTDLAAAKGDTYYKAKKFGSCADLFAGLLAMEPENAGYQLMMGMCTDMNGFKDKGRKDVVAALNTLKAESEKPDFKIPQRIKPLMAMMVIDYVDFLYKRNRFEESKSTIADAKVFLGDEKRVVGKYNIMNN